MSSKFLSVLTKATVRLPSWVWFAATTGRNRAHPNCFRALTVVDAYTRECLAIHVDQGIKGEQVVAVMDRLLFERGGAPDKIRVDNGPEFISRLDHWAYINRVTLDFQQAWKAYGQCLR